MATDESSVMVADIQQRTAQAVEQIRQLSTDLHNGVKRLAQVRAMPTYRPVMHHADAV